MYKIDQPMLSLLHKQIVEEINENADEQQPFLIAKGLLIKIVEEAMLGNALNQVMLVVQNKSMALVIECCGTSHIAEYADDPDTFVTYYSHCKKSSPEGYGVDTKTLLGLLSGN